MIVVMDREAGNIIEEVSSLEEGYALIEQYEAQDREEGTYEPDFYELAILPIHTTRFISM